MEHSFPDARIGHLTRLYSGFKGHKPNMVFLFHRGGGFYEAYFGDAFLLSNLGADLDFYEGIPICRMDHATATAYAHQLNRDQWDVGICERDEDSTDEVKKSLDSSVFGLIR